MQIMCDILNSTFSKVFIAFIYNVLFFPSYINDLSNEEG